jgi:hypothetical protein
LVGEAGAIQREQQFAVLRVGVVVPAQSVIAERQAGDDEVGGKDKQRNAVGNVADRIVIVDPV